MLSGRACQGRCGGVGQPIASWTSTTLSRTPLDTLRPSHALGKVARRIGRSGRSSTAALHPASLAAPSTASEGVRDMSNSMSLASIRNSLIRQEDTIIFNFIERAQFAKNDAVYTPGAICVPAMDGGKAQCSLLEYVLRETEQLHGSVRRYTSPDEHAFYPENLSALVLPPLNYGSALASCAQGININDVIMRTYLQDILPGLARAGDDNNYGSAATLDVLCLQALSKRIHYGKFVAEAKFRAAPEEYTALIRAGDSDAIMELLTDRAVEQKVLQRVRFKAATFGQDITEAPSSSHTSTSSTSSTAPGRTEGPPTFKIPPDLLDVIYRDIVMPLTKDVEVQYLLQRLQP